MNNLKKVCSVYDKNENKINEYFNKNNNCVK